MKHAMTLFALLACLAAASDASAAEPSQPTGGTPAPTVNVEGSGSAPISKTASAAEAQAAYHQALAAAVAAGLEKAGYMATLTGAQVGAIQEISEDGGDVACALHAEVGPLYESEPYEGAPLDIGYVGRVAVAPEQAAAAAASQKAPPAGKKRKKKRKPKAKKSDLSGCTVTTVLLLTYLLS